MRIAPEALDSKTPPEMQAANDASHNNSAHGSTAQVRMRSPLREHGETALDNGYIIVPVAPFEKKPSLMTARSVIKPMTDWQKMSRAKAERDIELWKSWGPGWGFGILAGVSSTEFGGILPVDIDILDRDRSEYFRHMASDILGPSGLTRVGKAPKQMIFYRMERCFKKFKVGDVELLGVGNQFIAAGYHPVTRGLYQHNGPDGALFDTHVSDVPLVEHAQFIEFSRAIAEAHHGKGSREVASDLKRVLRALKESGVEPESLAAVEQLYGVSLQAKADTYKSSAPPELARVAELLDAIPNDTPEHWDYWGQEIVGSVFNATGGSHEGLELFLRFSAKNPKFDHDKTLQKWREVERSPFHSYSVGTLYHHPKKNGWERPQHELLDLSSDTSRPVIDVTGKVEVSLPEEVGIEEAQRRTMAKAQHARDFIKSAEVVQYRLVHRAYLDACEAQRELLNAQDYLQRLKSGVLTGYNALPDTPEVAARHALLLDSGKADFSKLRRMTEKLAALPDNGGFDLSSGLLSFDQAVQAFPLVYGAAPPNKRDRMAAAEKRVEDAAAAYHSADGAITTALLKAKIEGVEISHPRGSLWPVLGPVGRVTVVFREPPSSGKSHAVNHAILADKDIRALVITSDHGGGGTKRLRGELQHLGDDYTILYGMTAENPNADPLPDGTQPKMCAFHRVIPVVKAAGGAASSMCGRPGTKHVCPKYNTCAFVQQPLNKRVTVVAGADAVQFFPQIAERADVLIYDDVAGSRMQMVDTVDISVFGAIRKMMPPDDAYHLGNHAMSRCMSFAQDFEALIEKAMEGDGRLSPTLIGQMMPGWVARGVIGEIAAEDWPSDDDLPDMLAEGWSPYLYDDCLELTEVEADLRRMVVPLHLMITPGGNPLARVDPATARWNAACIALADAASTLRHTMTLVRRVARVVESEDKVTMQTTRNIRLDDRLNGTPVLFLDGTAEEHLVWRALSLRSIGLPPTVAERMSAEVGHAVESVRWREPFRIRPFDGVTVRKLAGSELTLGKLAPPDREHFGDDDTTVDGSPTNTSYEKAVVTTANNREVLHRLSLRMRLFHGASGTGLTAPKAVEPLLRGLEEAMVARCGAGAGVLSEAVRWRQEYKARGDNSLSGVTGYISASRLGSQPVHYEDGACVAFGEWLDFADRHTLAPAHYPLRDGRVLEASVAVNPDPLGEIYRRDLVRGSVGQNGALRVRPGTAAGRSSLEAWELQAEPTGLYAYDDVVTMQELRDWANDVMTVAATGLLPLSHAPEVLAGPAGVVARTMKDRLKSVDGQERQDLDTLVEMYRQGRLPWQTVSLWRVPVAGVAGGAVVALSVPEGDTLAATRLLDAHGVGVTGVASPCDENWQEVQPNTLSGTVEARNALLDAPYMAFHAQTVPLSETEAKPEIETSTVMLPSGAWGDSVALFVGTPFEGPARAGVFSKPPFGGFAALMGELGGVGKQAIKNLLNDKPALRGVFDGLLPDEVNMINAVVTFTPKGASRSVKTSVMLIHPASRTYLEAKRMRVDMTGPFAGEQLEET
jgi:hypothetical protein